MSAPTFKHLQLAFAAHMRDPDRHPAPEGIEPRRVRVYRGLIYNNVRSFMHKGFPVLLQVLGTAVMDRLVQDWLAEHRATTPLFPRMPGEFVTWLLGRPDLPEGCPPWLVELAHYEWMELALQLDEADPACMSVDPEGDLLAGYPVLSPLAWPLAYIWPVHRIGPDFRPDVPSAPTTLIIHRSALGAVAFMETTVVTHRLLQLMKDAIDSTGRQLVSMIAGEIGRDEAELVEPGRMALQQLKDAGIVLGTRV